MTNIDGKLRKIKKDIDILDFGYFKKKNLLNKYENAFILIVSREDSTVINIDNIKVPLNKNVAIIYRPNQASSCQQENGRSFFVVLSGNFADQYIQNEKIGAILKQSSKDQMAGRIRQLEMVFDSNKRLDNIAIAELGFGLVLDIWMHKEKREYLPRVVSDAMSIIEDEYGSIYGVEDLAERVGVNKSYLIRRFKASVNITPGQYLENFRIKQAKLYLSIEEFDIEMIAKFCGYSSANYFGKVFRKCTGMSPTEYLDAGPGAQEKLDNAIYL